MSEGRTFHVLNGDYLECEGKRYRFVKARGKKPWLKRIYREVRA